MPRNGRASAALKTYNAKRDFAITPEPSGASPRKAASRALSFVIQKHDATRLHYDFRLELDGVLLSWAVPKGPSLDPADKRMAVRTEDHPLAYGGFEGEIPAGQYGAGRVIVWDNGTWEPLADPRAGLKVGKLPFVLHGQKLAGAWELIRMRTPDEKRENWLLFKKRDAYARPRGAYDVTIARPDSVLGKARPRAHKAAAKRIAVASGKRTEEPAPTQGDRAMPDGARRAALPASLAPQLATLANGVPQDGEWRYEVKFDGYRLLARIERGHARLITRNGNDWTARLPALQAAVEALSIRSAWLDGEIVVMNENGVPDFNLLQNTFDRDRTAAVRYFLFDLPYFDGYDLRAVAQRERRALLQALLGEVPPDGLQFSAELDADASSILDAACRMHLEGVIAKRTDAPYVSRRSETWLKLKCARRQEFVIGGFTERGDRRGSSEVGALLLGVHDEDGRLAPVGRVGTGWDAATARDLRRRLERLRAAASPFAVPPSASTRWSKDRAAQATHWVKPQLVAEVSFGEWTPGGQLRHASFVALRTDKPPQAITREKEVSMQASRRTAKAAAPAAKRAAKNNGAASLAKSSAKGGARSGDIRISNPDRVIDASTGTTKLDVVRYYEGAARWILPQLKDRPCSLVRAPAGIGGEIFFQKHSEAAPLPHVTVLDAALWPGHAALLAVDTAPALIVAAQMNTIEFHTWNAKAPQLDTPDRIVFDLDPGEGVTFAQVREGALLARAMLEELGLTSWLKTSGGKGLHVVVPIVPKRDADTVKEFSKQLVEHLARVIPDRFVARSGPKNRVGRIFVDYLRNGLGATTVAAFSMRARPGLGVSMTLAWDDLPDVKSGAHWTIRTALDHLSLRGRDPWAGYVRTKQSIDAAMKKLAPRR